MEKLIPVTGNSAYNYIKVSTRYDLGGGYTFSDNRSKRGFYLHVAPVLRENHGSYVTETITAFTGYRQLCKEVTRRTKKAEAEAEAIAENLYEAMIQRICREQGLAVVHEEAEK